MMGGRQWKIVERVFDLSRQGLIMGVLNVTTDSFSDGGKFLTTEKAVEHGMQMAAEGADLIDVGGESTRPGAEPVAAEEELHRVIPVIEKLRPKIHIPISIDTSKAQVASSATHNGVSRQGFLAKLIGAPEMEARLGPTLALTSLLRSRGADVFRVHDVKENATALRVTEAILQKAT